MHQTRDFSQKPPVTGPEVARASDGVWSMPPLEQSQAEIKQHRAVNARTAMGLITEELNRTIASAEKKFTALNLGVTALVNFDDDDPDDWTSFLRFGKDGKDWRLMVGSTHRSGDPDSRSECPLTNASRETRVNAIRALPALYDALIEQAEREAKLLAVDVGAAQSFLATLVDK